MVSGSKGSKDCGATGLMAQPQVSHGKKQNTEKTLEILKDGSRDSRLMCCLPRWELKSSVLRSPVPAGQLAVQPKFNPEPSLLGFTLGSFADVSKSLYHSNSIYFNSKKKQSENLSIYSLNWLIHFKVQDCQLGTIFATIWFQSCPVSHLDNFFGEAFIVEAGGLHTAQILCPGKITTWRCPLSSYLWLLKFLRDNTTRV